MRLEQCLFHYVTCALQEEVARTDDVRQRLGPLLELHAGRRHERVNRERSGIASNGEHDERLAAWSTQQATVVALEIKDHEGNPRGLNLHEDVEEERALACSGGAEDEDVPQQLIPPNAKRVRRDAWGAHHP